MSQESFEYTEPNLFTQSLFDKLKRHPKRIVFTEGEDSRVLRVAEKMVSMEIGVPILLGNAERIRNLAKDMGTKMDFIKVLEPSKSSDFDQFCKRYEKMERIRGVVVANIQQTVAKAQNFGAMMIQYGQADALVGGNGVVPGLVYRSLLHMVKPLPGVERIFGANILVAPHLEHFGQEGILIFADCALNTQPEVHQLASIAVETGILARHILGRDPRVVLLSHSTKGSNNNAASRRVEAATALAKERVTREFLPMEIDGELQADVALDAGAAEVKMPDVEKKPPADVLIFPTLDAGHISLKLMTHVAGAKNYGQIVLGLTRPAAQVPRTVSEEALLGTAAMVGVEASKFHQLYPDGDVV